MALKLGGDNNIKKRNGKQAVHLLLEMLRNGGVTMRVVFVCLVVAGMVYIRAMNVHLPLDLSSTVAHQRTNLNNSGSQTGLLQAGYSFVFRHEDYPPEKHGCQCGLCPTANMSSATANVANRTESCSIVVYTTAFYPTKLAQNINSLWLPPMSETNVSTCYVVLAGQSVASRLRELPYAQYWMIFVVPVDKNSRRASRIGKLDPFTFFPHAQHTMFLDFKLALLWKPAKAIKALLLDANASFAAFAHPCVSKSKKAISKCHNYPGDPLKPFILDRKSVV